MASVAIVLYTSKTLANGEHPIMVRTIVNGKPSYSSLGFRATKEQWDFERQRPNRKHPNKIELDILISKRLQEMTHILLEGQVHDTEVTADELLKPVKVRKAHFSFFGFAEAWCAEKQASGKLNTATSYRDAVKRMKKLLGVEDLLFRQITPALLGQLQAKMMANGAKESTVAVYMRSIRAIYKEGIARGLALESSDPFKSYKVSKLNVKTQKRAIKKDDIYRIKALELDPGSRLEFARKVFLFSFYCWGINFRDIAFLKSGNIVDGQLRYVRAKTGQPLVVNLNPPAMEIIKILRIHQQMTGSDYLFPILHERHKSAVTIQNRLKKIHTQVNADLKELGQMAGVSIPMTTYVARHTYATVLKRSGVATGVISESMGHATEKITQTYLASFERESFDAVNDALL